VIGTEIDRQIVRLFKTIYAFITEINLASSMASYGTRVGSRTCLYSPTPILFGLALHRRRVRIFDFQPKRRAAPAIGRAEPLRYDALAGELAGVFKYSLASARKMTLDAVKLAHANAPFQRTADLCDFAYFDSAALCATSKAERRQVKDGRTERRWRHRK
jgi:hypothetical protein